MTNTITRLIWPIAYYALTYVAVMRILAGSRQRAHRDMPEYLHNLPTGDRSLDPEKVLGWEYEYARITACEAMATRQQVVNFFLMATAILGTGVMIVFDGDGRMPAWFGTALLWLLEAMGWLFFLQLVRLRQAWHQSVEYMNRLKMWYTSHTASVEPARLREAFDWQMHTLPRADKPFNVFHYSAMLIALVNSAVFSSGGLLLAFEPKEGAFQFPSEFFVLVLVLLGVALFCFHLRMYSEFLRAPEPGQ